MSNKWTVIVESDPDTNEIIMPFPDDMIDELDWKVNDVLEWSDNQDGTWTLRKVSV